MAFHIRRLLGCIALISGLQLVSRVEKVTLNVGPFLVPLVAGLKCVPHL